MLFDVKNIECKIGERKLLKSQSFKLKKQDHLLIFGPSGAGKTTLLNLMSGLLKPSSGEIIFEDIKISSLNENDMDKLRAKKFGFIFQKVHLINHLTVKENIKLAINNEIDFDFNEIISELGLFSLINKSAKTLSFGESQRVAIARGIANQPRVIFADEPTSGLDDENTEKVMNLLFSQIKTFDSTLILCTHDQRIKKLFSNVLEITK